MQASKVDEDEVIDIWKAWKNKQGGKDNWRIFFNDEFRGVGTGFETFRKAMIAVHDGKVGDEWDGNEELPQEGVPKKAFPVIGLYKYALENNPERIKILAVGYCDDDKDMGKGLLTGKKRMAFANQIQPASQNWFVGIKGPKIQQWSKEGEITQDAMETWFLEGDRL